MVAKVKVDVTLASDAYDWGAPPASKIVLCWSTSKILDDTNTATNDDSEIASHTVHSIDINASTDAGKKKSHAFAKDTDGYVNIFILQGDKHYRIGEKNIGITVSEIAGSTESLGGLSQGTASGNVSVTQFSTKWLRVKAQGSDWGNYNSCNHGREGGTTVQLSDVSSIHDCAVEGVQAFDFDPDAKTCTLFRSNPSFSRAITQTFGRSKPSTECYMLKAEYDKVKSGRSGCVDLSDDDSHASYSSMRDTEWDNCYKPATAPHVIEGASMASQLETYMESIGSRTEFAMEFTFTLGSEGTCPSGGLTNLLSMGFSPPHSNSRYKNLLKLSYDSGFLLEAIEDEKWSINYFYNKKREDVCDGKEHKVVLQYDGEYAVWFDGKVLKGAPFQPHNYSPVALSGQTYAWDPQANPYVTNGAGPTYACFIADKNCTYSIATQVRKLEVWTEGITLPKIGSTVRLAPGE